MCGGIVDMETGIRRQAVYAYSNIAARSRTDCRRGKAVSFKYSYCVCSLSYPAWKTRAPYYCHFCSVWLYHIFPTLSHKRNDVRETVIVNKISGAWGGVVVKALRYYSDGPGIDSRWCHWIFQWHTPPDRTMALGSSRPLVKMSTRNISWG